MLVNWLARTREALFPPNEDPPKSPKKTAIWRSLAWLAGVIYGAIALGRSLGEPYIASDDGRQHIFWLYRFVDSDLFAKDWIADYFQSVAPIGYEGFYRAFIAIGIEPLVLAKVLPLALSAIAVGYCFALTLELFPVPAAAFTASFLFAQNLWMRDDLASATPRAFLNPIFLAFLYYFARGKTVPCVVTILLLGGFYPQYVLIASGLLVLLGWRSRHKPFRQSRELQLAAFGLVVAAAVLVPYALQTSDFGPVISPERARQLPEFLPGGRVRFFYEDFGRFWLSGGRSGLQPALDPPLLCAALLLPFLGRAPERFPLLARLRSPVILLLDLTLVSLFWFFAAHLFLFELHLPSRYSQHSLRIVFAIAAAIAIAALLDALFRWAIAPWRERFNESAGEARELQFGRSRPVQTSGWTWKLDGKTLRPILTLVLFLGTIQQLFFYQFSLDNFPRTNYILGSNPPLYEFLSQTPKGSTVASLSEEASNIPIFARRSVLVADEYAIPYHWGYYEEFQRRSRDLVRAQYSVEPVELREFLQQYEVDFWWLDAPWLSPKYVDRNDWLERYGKPSGGIERQLEAGRLPALAAFVPICTHFQNSAGALLETECISQHLDASNRI